MNFIKSIIVLGLLIVNLPHAFASMTASKAIQLGCQEAYKIVGPSEVLECIDRGLTFFPLTLKELPQAAFAACLSHFQVGQQEGHCLKSILKYSPLPEHQSASANCYYAWCFVASLTAALPLPTRLPYFESIVHSSVQYAYQNEGFGYCIDQYTLSASVASEVQRNQYLCEMTAKHFESDFNYASIAKSYGLKIVCDCKDFKWNENSSSLNANKCYKNSYDIPNPLYYINYKWSISCK